MATEYFRISQKMKISDIFHRNAEMSVKVKLFKTPSAALNTLTEETADTGQYYR